MEKDDLKLMHEEELDGLVKSRIREAKAHHGKIHRQWDDLAVEARNIIIYDYLRKGLSRQRVIEEIEKRWGVKYDSASDYYKKAIESLNDENAGIVDGARKVATERLNSIIEEAIKNKKYDSAIRSQDLLNKINGLYIDKQQVEVTGIKFDFGDRE